MEGYIDRFEERREVVRGWLTPGDAVDKLQVRRGGVAIETEKVTLFPPSHNLAQLKGLRSRQFSIRLKQPISVLDTLAGNVEVAFVSGEESKSIFPSAGLLKRELATLKRELAKIGVESDQAQRNARKPISANRPMPSGIEAPAPGTLLSPVGFPIGMTSPDEAVVLGAEGHFFPIGGANRILERYQDGRDSEREVTEWLQLIDRRRALAKAQGAVYKQVIIPDKMTMLAHLSPFDIQPPTDCMRLFVERSEQLEEVVKFNQLTFTDPLHAQGMWKKLDGHPTAYGAYIFSKAILESLDITLPDLSVSDFNWPTYQEGPLGERFFGFPVWDTVFNLRSPEKSGFISLAGEQLRGELGTDPSNPRIGIHFKYVNEHAPVDQVVVLVGTSTSGRGTHQSQLTWWIKQMFRELHFIWHTEFEPDLLLRIQPNIIIGQTVERYLARTPSC